MSEVVSRLTSALADRYRIEREIGAGGMATVYLAHDLKHDRDVAIKVLHPDLGAALGSNRFLTEIRTTAKLQHPHILPLLDSGEADGLLYYVMPYVTGETLRSRLEREQQLSINDAVSIACEVADALGAAHELGIVHRDIKPENILVRGNHAVVADFGIALAVQQAGGSRMTQTGLSLGTPQYMSPEQAMGERSIGARSDIYSLGAVTYEMLAGEPPFTGPSVQAIVAKVMSEKPVPLSTVRDTVPPNVAHAVNVALAKLPADRFATAAEFASHLTGQQTSSYEMPVARRRSRTRDPVVLGLSIGVIALGTAIGLLAMRSQSDADPFPARIEVASSTESLLGPAAISPDGHSIVFAARNPSGPGEVLYLRRLDRLDSRMIPGTVGATPPVFSPDGKSIAYIANRRRIVKVPLDGGPVVPLGDVADYGGIDWSSSGDIVVGSGVVEGLGGLLRVNASGGALVSFTKVDTARKELSHQSPRVLADGKTVLFTVWFGSTENAQLAATSLDDGKVELLGIKGTQAFGVVSGQLIYGRGDGMLLAQPFDIRRRRTSGVARVVQDSIRVRRLAAGSGVDAYVTHSGGLVFARGTANRQLVWVDRAGVATPALDDLREFQFARLSPDGQQAAVTIINGTKSDIWILDIATSTLTALTATGTVRNPVWSPDGRRILYVSTQSGRSAFWSQPADGSGSPTKVGEAHHNAWNIDLSPDGRTAVFNALYNGSFNLETFSLDPPHEEREIVGSPTATEMHGRFSPDGSLVAYRSDESGRSEVYVRPVAASGGRVQISTGGGMRPIWSPDGHQIYYWEGTKMMSATVTRAPTLRVISRQALFEGQYETDFDVSRDGKRFLMIESKSTGVSLVVVPNWLTELKQITASRSQQ